jgi:hypothetical protein
LSGLLRDRKDGVICKVGIIDYSVLHFEEVKVVGGEGRSGK